jgi:hypothetical protein
MEELHETPPPYDCIEDYPSYEQRSRIERFSGFLISSACSVGIGGTFASVLYDFEANQYVSIGSGLFASSATSALLTYISHTGNKITV